MGRRGVRRKWACLRPGTTHGQPILCRAPDLDKIFIATGHYRNGILLTPITAELMADVILDKPPLPPCNPPGATGPPSHPNRRPDPPGPSACTPCDRPRV
jgi:glycine/D-amino acid oxidase-like deaminating enzyme